MTLSPEQFNKIAMKEDLNRVEQKIDALAESVNNLIGSVAGLASDVKNVKLEQVSNIVAHDRFETRITKLETVVVD